MFSATAVSQQGISEEKNELGVLVVPLEGRLDSVTAPKFESWAKTSLDNVDKLILDFKNLEYVSSAGLRVLLRAEQMMAKRGGMKLINVNENVKDVFDATGFSEILTIE